MRILICGVAAIALSGCSWIGHSHNNSNYGAYNYGQNTGYNQNTVRAPKVYKPSKLSLTGALGTDFVVGGHAITGNDVPYNAASQIGQVSMQDAFKKGLRAELGAAYRLSNNNEVTLNGFYHTAKGKDGIIGQHVSGNDIQGQLSSYKGMGLEAGLRHNMGVARLPLVKSVTPYIEGRLGIAKISDVALQNVRVDGVVAAGPDQAFYEGGWKPTVSGLVGFEKPISTRTSIGLETGIRYTTKLGGVSPSPLGAEANNGSSRWSIPVQIRGRYRF